MDDPRRTAVATPSHCPGCAGSRRPKSFLQRTAETEDLPVPAPEGWLKCGEERERDVET